MPAALLLITIALRIQGPHHLSAELTPALALGTILENASEERINDALPQHAPIKAPSLLLSSATEPTRTIRRSAGGEDAGAAHCAAAVRLFITPSRSSGTSLQLHAIAN